MLVSNRFTSCMTPSSTTKPRVFVGSSVESLDIAYAVQENLEFVAEVTVWSQGIFDLTRTTLQSLMQAVDTFDFAVFIFTPDDVLKMRGETSSAVRDNVVFELGLFLGGLGEDRAFIILPRGAELHLPTDLAGVTPATYETKRRDNNFVAALGPACTRIKRAMEESGLRQVSSEDASTLTSPIAAGLSEELQSDIAQMLQEQEIRIQEVFEQFEQRVAEMLEAKQETAKAPISRIAHLIRNELSEGAKRILRQLVISRLHLTRKQYESLNKTEYAPFIEELRRNYLLVPLTGRDEKGEKIPVYWLPPGTKNIVTPIITEMPDDDPKATKDFQKVIIRLGYVL